MRCIGIFIYIILNFCAIASASEDPSWDEIVKADNIRKKYSLNELMEASKETKDPMIVLAAAREIQFGPTPDIRSQAAKFYQIAADLGSIEGKFQAACYLAKMNNKEDEKINKLLEGAAQSGHVTSAFLLGKRLLSSDACMAENWLLKASECDGEAAFFLAEQYRDGTRLKQSNEKFKYFLIQAKNMNWPPAHLAYADVLVEGKYFEKDVQSAKDIYAHFVELERNIYSKDARIKLQKLLRQIDEEKTKKN